MADGKIRHKNHIIEDKTYRFLQDLFPDEWVQRKLTPDYGIDIDLELFGFENDDCVTLGEHIFLQVKGTESAVFGTINPVGKQLYTEKELADMQIPVLKFSLDVSLLKMVERMGSAIPVLLTVVDLTTQVAYYICLNDYVRHILSQRIPDYRNQESVTVYIPTSNILRPETVSWYGKRAKLYGLFQELLTLADDVQYMNANHKIDVVSTRLTMIASSDAWNADKNWPLLNGIRIQLTEMLHNDMINMAGKGLLDGFVKEGEDPSSVMVHYGSEPDPVSAYTAAKAISCDTFLDQAKAVCAAFENNVRHMGLPTQVNWMLSH